MRTDVEDWLWDFMERHRKRYRPWDWPEPDSDELVLFLEVWSRALDKIGASEDEADDASIDLGANPPKYRGDHLPAIIRAIEAARAERRRLAPRIESYPPREPDPIILPEGVESWRDYWRWMLRRGGVVAEHDLDRAVHVRRGPWRSK